MLEQEYEEQKAILSLCYSRLAEIEYNKFIAVADNKYGIIDINNNILMPFECRELRKYGSIVVINDGLRMKRLDLDTYISTGDEIYTIEGFGDAAIISYQKYRSYGVFGKGGKVLMPCMYDSIRFNGVYGNHYKLWVKLDDHSFNTEVSMDCTKVSILDYKDSGDSTIGFAATSFSIQKMHYGLESNYKFGYELYTSCGILTNKQFDDMAYLTNYKHLGIINTWKNGYAGMIRKDGKEVVPPVSFNEVECLGYNGIYFVSDTTKHGNHYSYKWGVYKEDIGLIVNNIFESKYIMKSIPAVAFVKDNRWYVLGNDGYLHTDMLKAFPVCKLIDTNEDLYVINLYGHRLVINKNYEVLLNKHYSGRINQIGNVQFEDIVIDGVSCQNMIKAENIL